jgi:hypothetical protein
MASATASWVDSYTDEWAAEDAALRVRGMKAVANDPEVRVPASEERAAWRASGVAAVENPIQLSFY